MTNLKEIKICAEPLIKINGRTVKDKDPLHLFWTGSGIEFNIKATELYIVVEGLFGDHEHYLAFEINGMVTQRVMLDGTKQCIPVFKFFCKDKINHVRIIKEVQAMNEDSKHMLNIYSIKTDGEIISLDEEIDCNPNYSINENVNNNKNQLKIEFIGDSINSGEGAIGTGNDELWISHYFSHIRSYPYMVAKLLNADYRVFSKSGWGVHCAWDNNTMCALPNCYEEICSVMPKGSFDELGIYEKNDFTSWQPDIIVCNLGTNDDGAFHNPEYVDENGNVFKLHMDDVEKNIYNEADTKIFENDVYNFLIKLRKNNPKAKIYWAFGILGKGLAPFINNAINKYNEDYNENVSYIDLPVTEGEGFGARWHPGILSHKDSAYVIANTIKNDFNIDKLERLIL